MMGEFRPTFCRGQDPKMELSESRSELRRGRDQEQVPVFNEGGTVRL